MTRYTVDDFHTVIMELNGESDYEEPGFLGVIDYEKKRQEKEFIQSFIASKDNEEELVRWKQANKEKQVKENTFCF